MGVGSMGEVRIEVSIYITCNGGKAGGRGLVEILKAIRETGSIRLAAEKLGINYRRIWGRIRRAEKILGIKLVEGGHGGSRITAEAERIIEAFTAVEEKLRELGLSEGVRLGISCP
jgi:molybdate transport system regulatory protein